MADTATFRSVFAVGEFRALWFAELLSIAGDQLARVALSVLVYQRTSSATLTGLTFALTYLPTMLGGILLAGLGDRFPRREVMVVADLVRACLVAVMAIPGVPFWLLCVLLTFVVISNGPFKAAQLALLPDVLEGERFVVGLAVRNITSQSAQLAGFAGGGVLVAVLNPYIGLAINAVTFVASGLLVRFGVGYRAAPTPEQREPSGGGRSRRSLGTGAKVVWRDPRLRAIAAISWLAIFYIAPEALAAPYAAELGYGAFAVGLLMAADPIGSVIGAFIFSRFVPEQHRLRVIGVLGVFGGVPLIGCVFEPGLAVSMILFALSGAFATAYTMQCSATAVRLLPDHVRAQGIGLLSTVLLTVQGIGALIAGVLADVLTPTGAVAVAGAVGALLAIPAAVEWARSTRANPIELSAQPA
jgi:MFS family permease